MHLLKNPRVAALIGISSIVIAAVFWIVPTVEGLTVDYNDVAAGTTMLVFLGVATALMAYVLVAGSTDT